MPEKNDEKPAKGAGKLTLFNHSRNPYHLGKNADGTERWFRIGKSIECVDQKEYDMLKNYKGVATTQQVAPGLQAHVQNLQEKIAAQNEEIAELKKQAEKFQDKKGK
jgi:hypothetical protein